MSRDKIQSLMRELPGKFIWGTATSAYQIEGAAFSDGKKASIWDDFVRVPGNVKNGDTGDHACDHYHHYREDADLLSALGVGAYRFSLSWPRLLPDGTGAVNMKGVDFYKRLLQALHEKNIVPYVTLYHWDLPSALQGQGGWTNRNILHWFEEYAGAVIKHLGSDIPNFIILNEPSVVAYVGHYEGKHAPGIKSASAMYAAMHHLNMVHGQIFRQIKAAFGKTDVASSYTHFQIYPAGEKPENREAAALMMSIWSDGFLSPAYKGVYPDNIADKIAPYVRGGDMELCRAPGDFLGINHYCRDFAEVVPGEEIPARLAFSHNAGATGQGKTTDLGWPIVPEGLYEALVDLKERYFPARVIITEGGCAFNDSPGADGKVHDQRRIDYYAAYLEAAFRARSEGVPLEGYFAWSFLDNFEWAEGFWPRFGLVYVDYKNGLRRIPKESFYWYKSLIQK